MFRKILIVALIALPVLAISQRKNKNKQSTAVATGQDVEALKKDEHYYKYMYAPMPPIRAITEQRKEITNADLKGEGNTLLMMFNPTCEHCSDMTLLMEKNIFLFKKTKILYIAAAGMMPYLDYFKNTTKFDQFPSIQVGIDSAKTIDVLYNAVTLPQINIYNPEHKLIKTFNGDTPLDSLKMYID